MMGSRIIERAKTSVARYIRTYVFRRYGVHVDFDDHDQARGLSAAIRRDIMKQLFLVACAVLFAVSILVLVVLLLS